VDSQIDPEADRALERHLESCDACRLEWQKMRALDNLFRSATVRPAPPHVRARVVHRIERRGQARRAVVGGITLALGTSALAVLMIIPIVWSLFGSLGAAPALLAGAGETVAQLLILFTGVTRVLVALLDRFALPFAALALGSLFAALVLNGLWIATLRRLRVAR
jgi:anti-sigma factor RsiW